MCSEGHAVSLVLTCSKCSNGNLAVVIVALGIVSLAAFALVWHMVSLEQGDNKWGIFSRVEAILPLQSIKIVVVAWQIVTQVNTPGIPRCGHGRNTWQSLHSGLHVPRTFLF